MEWLIAQQLPIIASIQTVVQSGPPLFLLKLVIFFAEENVFILTVCGLFWLVDRRIAVTALLLLLGSEYVNFALKWTFHQPRPYWLSEAIVPLSRQPDFGFPTAYAQDALVFWAYLGYAFVKRTGNRRFWLLPAVIVPLVSIATVLSGANFFHDTLAGLALGAAILLAVRGIAKRLKTRPVGGATAGVLVMLAAPLSQVVLFLMGLLMGPIAIPGLWRSLAMRGTDLPPYLVFSPYDASLMVGLSAGILAAGFYIFVEARGLLPRLQPVRSRESGLARVFTGLFGLAVIKISMILVLDGARDVQVALVYGLGYLGIALWAMLGAPLLHALLEERRYFGLVSMPVRAPGGS